MAHDHFLFLIDLLNGNSWKINYKFEYISPITREGSNYLTQTFSNRYIDELRAEIIDDPYKGIYFCTSRFGVPDGMYIHTLDILFPSNHNIHNSSYGICFLASDPLIERML